jgi:putative transposase
MPRQPRNSIDNGIYHVLNCGNCRMNIFTQPSDFQAFVKLLEEARQRFDMRLLGYCLMHNHWHLVLWPRRGPDLSRFMGWLCTTHVRRWREHRGSAGQGHLYQGRFKSFLIQEDEHFLNVLRYVEANPLRAAIVRHAQDWPWSSLGRAPGSDNLSLQLTPWPLDKPARWTHQVNQQLDPKTLQRLHDCIARNRPFGDDAWTSRTAKRLHLESTLRDPWRPRKPPTQKESHDETKLQANP